MSIIFRLVFNVRLLNLTNKKSKLIQFAFKMNGVVIAYMENASNRFDTASSLITIPRYISKRIRILQVFFQRIVVAAVFLIHVLF